MSRGRRDGKAPDISHLLDIISSSPATYAIVFAVVALDALLPFVQAEAVVITAAVLAAQGDLKLWLIVPAAALGGIVGDNVSYFVGSRVGCRVVGRFSRRGR